MARLLDQLVGHQQIVSRFFHALSQERLPHTFLLVGPSGVGKKLTAFALAQALVCENSTQACGVCGACVRISKLAMATKKGEASHSTESVLLIEPERSMIKIDQAREIIEFLSLRSVTRRAVIIDSAETLNPQAANSLLKVLEEPPMGSYFFLIAPGPSQVLPTLRSRSQIVRFSPLAPEEMKKRTRAPEWAIRASGGSFEKLQMLTERTELEIRESACLWLKAWMKNPQGYLQEDLRAVVRDRSVAPRLADHLLSLLRDALFYQAGAKDAMMNLDKENFIAALAEFPAPGLHVAVEKALQLQKFLEQNFDSSLAFEQFWIESRLIPAEARAHAP
jgi:DNA polymerase-3 subunit delta'